MANRGILNKFFIETSKPQQKRSTGLLQISAMNLSNSNESLRLKKNK